MKTGAAAAGKTEILGDLKDGDQIVVPASDELAPGTSVAVHLPTVDLETLEVARGEANANLTRYLDR